MKKLVISENLKKLDHALIEINKEIKAKKLTKREILISLFKETKNLMSDPKFEAKEYLNYSKNAKKELVEIELEKESLSKWTLKLLIGMLKYYASESSLNFSDKSLSLTKFLEGMKLLGKDEKYTSNAQLFKKVLKDDLAKSEKSLKAKKEQLKAMI